MAASDKHGKVWLFIVVCLTAAVSASFRLWPLGELGASYAWLTFYPGVMFCALYGGFAAGLLSTILACLTVKYLWPLFAAAPFINSRADWIAMTVFAFTGTVASSISVALRRANARMAEASGSLDRANQALNATAHELAGRERFLKTIADSLPSMVAYWDQDLRCRFANKPYLEWFGKTPESLIGTTLQELLGERLFAANEPFVRRALAGEQQTFERTLTKADGSIGETLAHYIPDVTADGSIGGFYVLVNDVTPLKLAERQARDAEHRVRIVLDHISDGVIAINRHGVILSANPAAQALFGYRQEEMVGAKVNRLMPEPHRSRHDGYLAYYFSRRGSSLVGKTRELTGLHRDGRTIPLELVIAEASIGDERIIVGVLHDIAERRKLHEELVQRASTDGLTGLATRRTFDERLGQEHARHRRSNMELSIVMLDVDHFKSFNDTYGHIAGDQCLRDVARAIRGTVVRTTDLAARYGGEEFVCLLPETDSANAKIIAERLRAAIAGLYIPHAGSPTARSVTASVGVATLHCDHNRPELDIIALADEQLYAAKAAGRNQVRAVSRSE